MYTKYILWFSLELPHRGSEVILLSSKQHIWAAQAKTCILAYADSEGPDQTAHPRSLIWAFAVRKHNPWMLKNVSMETKYPDETLRIRRIMRILSFCACSKPLFRLTRNMFWFKTNKRILSDCHVYPELWGLMEI